MRVSRRRLLQAAWAGSTLSWRVGAAVPGSPLPDVMGVPDHVFAVTESGRVSLLRDGQAWSAQDIRFISKRVVSGGKPAVKLTVQASRSALRQIHVRWRGAAPSGVMYLGDDWERSYGDLGWRGLDPERVLPWYALASNGRETAAVGVKTGANAFSYWQIDSDGLVLVLDIRSGGGGIVLGERELLAATLVAEDYAGPSPFAAARQFCARMCDSPRLPPSPVYGGNNWYYAYGKSSAKDIRDDSQRVASWSPHGGNRPWMVIDDGWQPFETAGPWDRGNERFPDMQGLAAEMQRMGVRPGIWNRPLFTKQAVPEGWKLRTPGAKRELGESHGWTLDPSIPEVLDLVQSDVRRIVSWGYQLIKHDYSTYDTLGRWGSTMGAALTDDGWRFGDRSRTTAEIISAFYRAIRAAAGDALVLGCNTVGHLSAGLFEMQRTGDDTSGREWARTRKMGVNTLAFRAPQHGTFFAIDADCVGLTLDVPWGENRQWLDLLARSGTPLFISAAPKAVGPEQARALRDAFAHAGWRQPLGEPLDWMATTQPENWNLGGDRVSYDWFLE